MQIYCKIVSVVEVKLNYNGIAIQRLLLSISSDRAHANYLAVE